MKFFRVLQIILALSLVFSAAFVTSVGASTFRDVPSNHFALEAIRWVSSPSNGSFMVGDASNNFNPGRVMDSFESAITFAMAAGFRYSPASITPADQAMFDLAYQRHRPLLTSMAEQHPNWRRAADREIAFLLELGVFTQEDLALFMSNGAAASLTKEAASAFVLRLTGNDDFTEPGFTFRDDSEIRAMYRPYAYLAHSLGVVDDYDGYFTPRRNITRAELAQMFHTLRVAAPGTPGASTPSATPTPTPPPPFPTPTPIPLPGTTPSGGSSPFASTLHGTIHSVQSNSVQITTETGTGSHVFGTNPVIVVDNIRREVANLVPGMLVAVGLNTDGQIISLLALTEASQPPAATPSPMPTPTPLPTPLPTPSPTVSPDAITPYAFDVRGSLISRRFVNMTPVLVIEVIGGNTHELSVSADTYILRNGETEDWTAIRIGDEISARVEHNRVVRIQAMGRRTSGQGTIEEIRITQENDTITIRHGNSPPLRIALPPEVYDIYDLRIGMEVQVYLDSREIYELTVLDGTVMPGGTGFIGYVQSLRHGHTMVVTLPDDNRQTIRIDGNTINTATGEPVIFRNLRTHMRLYIVMQPNGNIARSITILP